MLLEKKMACTASQKWLDIRFYQIDLQTFTEKYFTQWMLTCAVIFLNKSFFALSILLPLVAPNEIFSSSF